jgi:hypothetical protein
VGLGRVSQRLTAASSGPNSVLGALALVRPRSVTPLGGERTNRAAVIERTK